MNSAYDNMTVFVNYFLRRPNPDEEAQVPEYADVPLINDPQGWRIVINTVFVTLSGTETYARDFKGLTVHPITGANWQSSPIYFVNKQDLLKSNFSAQFLQGSGTSANSQIGTNTLASLSNLTSYDGGVSVAFRSSAAGALPSMQEAGSEPESRELALIGAAAAYMVFDNDPAYVAALNERGLIADLFFDKLEILAAPVEAGFAEFASGLPTSSEVFDGFYQLAMAALVDFGNTDAEIGELLQTSVRRSAVNENGIVREAITIGTAPTPGTAADDTVIGGTRDDIFALRGGNDKAHGGFGYDAISGASGDDLLFGGQDDDTLDGGEGNDTLDGGSGADFLKGGGGDDVIDGGVGEDTALFSGTIDTAVALNATTAQATGHGNDRLINIENVTTASGNDRISGDRLSNMLISNAGNDTIHGGRGNDTLKAGTGDDLLVGGSGKDRLYGGAGADIFEFRSGFGKDRIVDFEDDVDIVLLYTVIWGGGLTAEEVVSTFGSIVSGASVLDFGAGNRITFAGFDDLSELTNDLLLV